MEIWGQCAKCCADVWVKVTTGPIYNPGDIIGTCICYAGSVKFTDRMKEEWHKRLDSWWNKRSMAFEAWLQGRKTG